MQLTGGKGSLAEHYQYCSFNRTSSSSSSPVPLLVLSPPLPSLFSPFHLLVLSPPPPRPLPSPSSLLPPPAGVKLLHFVFVLPPNMFCHRDNFLLIVSVTCNLHTLWWWWHWVCTAWTREREKLPWRTGRDPAGCSPDHTDHPLQYYCLPEAQQMRCWHRWAWQVTAWQCNYNSQTQAPEEKGSQLYKWMFSSPPYG